MLRSWCIRPYCADPFWFHLAEQSAISHSSVHRKCAMFSGLVTVDIRWPWIHGKSSRFTAFGCRAHRRFPTFASVPSLRPVLSDPATKNRFYPRDYSRRIFKIIPNICQTWIDLWVLATSPLDPGKTDLREFYENVKIFNVFLQLRLRSQERDKELMPASGQCMDTFCGGHVQKMQPGVYVWRSWVLGESFCDCTFHQQNGNF